MLEELLAQVHHVQGIVVPLSDVVAFAEPTASDDHPVRSLLERTEHEGQVYPPGTHQADDPDFRCIGLSGHAREVSSRISLPVAEESDDPRRMPESCFAFTFFAECQVDTVLVHPERSVPLTRWDLASR